MLPTENELVDFTAFNGYFTIPILGLIGFCTNVIYSDVQRKK